MLRPIATIVAAVLLSRPELAPDEAARWAAIVQAEAKARGFDPLSMVALVHSESGWHPGVVSPSAEDYGLGQVRARFVGACKKDADPVHSPSPECRAVKESLLDPEQNLRVVAQLITDNRKLCLEKAKSSALPRWLASYQGLNFPKQKRWCVPAEKTWKVVKYRELLLKEAQKPKPPAKR
ncbi:MAG: transglycosylase SLT domain-containing protein [Myxococcales bacterium]|nr:transglycosylase SLT domain-containing protein [Myxococcales bacterium]